MPVAAIWKTPPNKLLAREQADRLLGYLQELPIKCQQVLGLHRFEGLSQQRGGGAHGDFRAHGAALCDLRNGLLPLALGWNGGRSSTTEGVAVSSSDPTMSDIPRLRDASEWVQRLHESDAQELVDAWLQWCRSDPRNLPAFEQMQRLWNALPKPRDTNRHPAEPVPVARPTRRRIVALAASVALLVGAAAWIALSYSQIEVQGTAAGEQRHIALADGSQLYLAPNSRVSARFTLTRRDVRLEGGQAFFAVAHSALRPFVVHANESHRDGRRHRV